MFARKRRCDRQAGFSLIEVLAAMLLMCIGLLALFSTFGTAVLADAYAAERSDALHLAHEQIEAVKGLPFEQIVAKSEQADRNGSTYTCQVNVRQDSEDLKDVTVSIAWMPHRPGVDVASQVQLATAVLRR